MEMEKEGNNNELGECLKEIRTVLDSENKEIDLNNFHKKGLFIISFQGKIFITQILIIPVM